MTSVRSRILLFFTVFSAVSLFAVYLSSRSTQVVGDAANSIVTVHLPLVEALSEMEIALQRQDNAMYRYVTSGDKIWMDECEKHRSDYTRWFLSAKRWADQEHDQYKLDEIDELYVQYDNLTRHVFLNPQRGSRAVQEQLKSSGEFLARIQKMVDELQGIRLGMTIERKAQIRGTLHRHGRLTFYFLMTIGMFFLALAFYLWRFLVQPLTLILEGIRNFTRGKTDIQIPSIGKDELGELQEAFNEMSRELTVERKRLQSESQSDSLTGLFNMRYFRLQLAEEFSRSQRYGRPLTLIMIDVDYFKKYNDLNGHPAGDIVLKEIARILIRNVRGTDVVARYGGEEFVVLLPETPLESAVNVAQKIRKAVEDHYFPFQESQTSTKLTVSLGVASYPDGHVTNDQDLVEASDKALYSAKKNGRNQVRFFSKGEIISSLAVAPPAVKSTETIKN